MAMLVYGILDEGDEYLVHSFPVLGPFEFTTDDLIESGGMRQELPSGVVYEAGDSGYFVDPARVPVSDEIRQSLAYHWLYVHKNLLEKS